MENERISSANIYAGAGSGLNNPAYVPNINASNANLSRPPPVVVQNSNSEIGMKDFHTNSASSGPASTEHISTASSSAHPPMELVRTNSLFIEDDHDGPQSAVVTRHSSDKRKFPEGSWDESSVSARKRSVQISGNSGLQAAPHGQATDNALVISSSSANVLGLGSTGSLRSGAVPLARSSLFESLPEPRAAGRSQNIQQNTQMRIENALQDSGPTYSVSSGADIRQNAVVQRPRLVLPPPQAVGEGSNVNNHPMPVTQPPRLVLPAPQAVGEVSNVENHQMPVHYPATPQHIVQFTGHHNGSGVIPSNSSGPALAMGTIQVQETGLRNSTRGLQLPVIAPPVGSRNLRRNPMNRASSGGVAVARVNVSSGLLSDPIPSGPRSAPSPVSNGHRRIGAEQIRQALLAIDLTPGASNPLPNEISLHSGANSQRIQILQQRASLLRTTTRNHSNFGVPDHSASTNSFDIEARQRLLSRPGANVRQSFLSALADIQDQHRDMRLDVDNMSYEELLELGDRIGHVKTGLGEEVIMKCLKHYAYTCTVNSSKPVAEPCSICQEEYAEGEDLGALDCGHEYHTNCIKQWLVLKNSCPICKAAASSSK